MTSKSKQYYFRFRICWYRCLQKVKVYEQTKFRRLCQLMAEMSVADVRHTSVTSVFWSTRLLDVHAYVQLTTVIWLSHVYRHSATVLVAFAFQGPPSGTHSHKTYEAVTFPGNSSSVDLRHGCFSVLMCRWRVWEFFIEDALYKFTFWLIDWYNYFRFWITNVRHIRNLLSVSISSICPKSAHYSASGYRILSKSKHPLRKYDVISMYQDAGRDGWILLPVSYLLMSLPSEGQSLSANQICRDISNRGWYIFFMAIQNGLGKGQFFFKIKNVLISWDVLLHVMNAKMYFWWL